MERRKGSTVQTKWLSIALLAGWAGPAWALVVTPARTEIRLAPGARTRVELTATNDDKVKVQVDVSKKDWFIPEANKAWTVGRWLDVRGPARFHLKPGKSRKVQVDVKCPKDMSGEVVAMVSFLYQTTPPSMVTPMISVSMYLIVAGTEKMEGRIKDLIVRKRNDQVNIAAVVKATGNVHLRPRGRFVVLDAQGVERGQVIIPEGQPTYPGTEIPYYGSLPANVKLSSGPYTVRADMSYGDFKVQANRDFTVLPDGQIQMGPIK